MISYTADMKILNNAERSVLKKELSTTDIIAGISLFFKGKWLYHHSLVGLLNREIYPDRKSSDLDEELERIEYFLSMGVWEQSMEIGDERFRLRDKSSLKRELAERKVLPKWNDALSRLAAQLQSDQVNPLAQAA